MNPPTVAQPTAEVPAEVVAEQATAVAAAPEPVSARLPFTDADRWIARADVFDVGPLPVKYVRVEGAMFAASTRAAIASQRPTAMLRIVRTQYIPRHEGSGLTASESYKLEIDQRPGGRVAVGEEEAAQLLSALQQSPRGPVPSASEVVFGKMRLAFDREGDDVRIETEKVAAVYERAGLQAGFERARGMIDSFRVPRENGK